MNQALLKKLKVPLFLLMDALQVEMVQESAYYWSRRRLHGNQPD